MQIRFDHIETIGDGPRYCFSVYRGRSTEWIARVCYWPLRCAAVIRKEWWNRA
jgi:hypothetical protein